MSSIAAGLGVFGVTANGTAGVAGATPEKSRARFDAEALAHLDALYL